MQIISSWQDAWRLLRTELKFKIYPNKLKIQIRYNSGKTSAIYCTYVEIITSAHTTWGTSNNTINSEKKLWRIKN